MEKHGNTSLLSMTFQFGAGATLDRGLFPGAALDPGHTTLSGPVVPAREFVWLASGTIEKITCQADSAQDVVISIFDASTLEGAPIKLTASSTNPGSRHAFLDTGASATGERRGYGGGAWALTDAFMDVRSNVWPGAIVDSSKRWQETVRKLDAAAGRMVDVYEFCPEITCLNGMAVRLVTTGATGEALDFSILYRPHTLGAQRFDVAARGAAGVQVPGV